MDNKQCCECRKGEHPNYDDDIQFCQVKDPDKKGFVLRGYLCGEHREAMRSDGYIVFDKDTRY